MGCSPGSSGSGGRADDRVRGRGGERRADAKIQANASLAANRTYKTLAIELEKGSAELEKLKKQSDPTRLGRSFHRAAERLQQLSIAKTQLETKQAEAAAKQDVHLAARVTKERSTGRKLRGRKPKAVPATPKEEDQAQCLPMLDAAEKAVAGICTQGRFTGSRRRRW